MHEHYVRLEQMFHGSLVNRSALIEMDFATTTALLPALAPMIPDEVLVATIRRGLAQRRRPLPHWLTGLAPPRPVGTYVMAHCSATATTCWSGWRRSLGFR